MKRRVPFRRTTHFPFVKLVTIESFFVLRCVMACACGSQGSHAFGSHLPKSLGTGCRNVVCGNVETGRGIGAINFGRLVTGSEVVTPDLSEVNFRFLDI